MRKRRWLYGALMVFVLSGCVSQVEVIERGDRNCERRVLIATQQSEFKDAVVSGILEGLDEDSCYMKVINLKKLADESTAHYDVLVVVNTCKMGRLNGRARRFFKHVQEKEEGKIILLTTVGSGDYEPKIGKVDAITSASEMEKAGALAERIAGKVRAFLAKAL